MTQDGAIILRPAEAADSGEIRHLIHAEGKTWSSEYILRNIGRLYVLTYGKRILGVLCGTFTPGKETVSWVAVHPMYPESSLRAAMIQGLGGILCRRPLSDGGREKRQGFSFSRWLSGVSHFKFRGVKHGISGQQKL